MRLTVPEPKIDLYNDGFADHDQLDRKATGDKLSDLVERIDDPMVIALDGAWGSGKSFFLKCWVGEHLKRKGNTTQTVYFDAFGHDFLDDPLIALTGAIAERFERDKKLPLAERESRVQKLKKFGWVLGKSSAKIGVSVAGHYAKKLVGEECLEEFGKDLEKASQKGVATAEDEVKTLIDSGKGSEASEVFWREQRAKIVAMSAFREVLTELTEPATKEQAEDDPKLQEGTPTGKLVVVIDELDRCRPDYALSLLEIIKHFFNVPGVHFVLGCNMEALAWTIRSRYGENYDARRYLQRFVNLKLRLPQIFNPELTKHPIENYFFKTIEQMGLNESPYLPSLKSYISNMWYEQEFSMRDLHQLLGRLAITTPPDHLDNYDEALVAGLLILEAFAPDAISKVRMLEGKMQEVTDPLKLRDPLEDADHQECINWAAWAACLGDINDIRFEVAVGSNIGCFANGHDRERIRNLLEQHIDVFETH